MVERNNGNSASLRRHVFQTAREAALQEDPKPDPKGHDNFANRPFFSSNDFHREDPPKDHMRRYWRQYETTPMVRNPINNFARQIVEPGYWVQSETLSDDQLKETGQWLQKAAYMGTPGNDIARLIKKSVIQREVRGTILIEKVFAVEDKDRLTSLRLLHPETVKPNKRPNQGILLAPDDDEQFPDIDLPRTDDGDVAAWTQFRSLDSFGRHNKDENANHWTRDDVILLRRDADVGEIFGTSRLESSTDRIEGLKNKLRDNDEAIASKAYPLWLFMFGSEERPWDRDDIDKFMKHHEMDNFHPGMKQGVRGDINVETISGEVADIAESLQFDLDYIMSAMPLPKYTLGAFESQINQFVTRSQERDTQRQIREARREIESELTPVVRQWAGQQFDFEEGELMDLEFKLGRPGEERREQMPNIHTINYLGVDQGQGNGDGDGRILTNGGGQQQGQGDGQQNGGQQDSGSEEGSVWDVPLSDVNTEELADPRLVSTTDLENELSSDVAALFTDFRIGLLDEIETEFQDAPQSAAVAFTNRASTRLNQALSQSTVRSTADDVMEDAVRRTLDTLGQDNQEITIDVPFGTRHRQNVRSFSVNVDNSVRDAMEEMVRRMRTKFRRGSDNGESLGTILSRVRNSFTDDELRQRARLIAQMEVANAIETTKIQEFEQHEDVVAVKPINTCGPNTTPLCRDLAGCGGDAATARFGASLPLSQQWMEQTSRRKLFEGFTPLPPAPPWHFNCESELVPITRDELEEMEPQPGNVYSIEELEEKYGIEVE